MCTVCIGIGQNLVTNRHSLDVKELIYYQKLQMLLLHDDLICSLHLYICDTSGPYDADILANLTSLMDCSC